MYLRATAVFVAALCVTASQAAAPEGAKMTNGFKVDLVGPERIEPGEIAVFTVGDSTAKRYAFTVIPANPHFHVDSGGQRAYLAGKAGTGPYTVVLVGIDGELLSIDTGTCTIGKPPGPTPPDPIPPTPPDPVPPDPIPPQPSGFRVLILEETAERGKLPAKQLSALLSNKARDYLNSKTAKVGNTPEWRMFDDDQTDTSFLADNWKKAVDLARKDSAGKLPWIIVSDGAKGESKPFPQSEQELLDLLKKYGG